MWFIAKRSVQARNREIGDQWEMVGGDLSQFRARHRDAGHPDTGVDEHMVYPETRQAAIERGGWPMLIQLCLRVEESAAQQLVALR